ncbi:MAG: hypothetical protein PHV16_01025 [Candidatus Nanoarchaeia archaeon]|nr:hypothetical protein [Candidatus Nanoarchaeia archaeon]
MKNFKILRNKKGLDDDLTDAFIGIVFTAIIFIFAFIFLAGGSKVTQVSSVQETKNLENTYTLLNYLRAETEKNVNMGEYIGSLEKNKIRKECSSIESETREILEGIEEWHLTFYTIENKVEKETCNFIKFKGLNDESSFQIIGDTVSLMVPSIDNNIDGLKFYFKLNIFAWPLGI